MKINKFAKGIVSIIMAMSVVLSFALVSISADSVPAGGNVEFSGVRDFEEGSGNNFFSGYTTSLVTDSTIETRGEYSCALTDTTDKGAGYLVATFFNSDFVSSGPADSAIKAGTYYVSFYVYSPDTTITLEISRFGAPDFIINEVVPQGQWTKVSGMAIYDEDMADEKENSRLWDFQIVNMNGKTVYVDDFVIAKLSSIDNVALTETSFEYNYETNTAVAKYSSSVELAEVAEANVTASNGATVTSVDLSADGRTITVGLSNLELDSTYDIEFKDVDDAFKRTTTLDVQTTTPVEYVLSDVTETVVDTTATYTATIKKNTPGSINVAFIVAAYNADGTLADIGMDDIKAVSNTSGVVSFEAEITKGVTYKAILVDWASLAIIE